MAAGNARPGSRIEQPAAMRPRSPAAVEHGLSMAETLNVALQQATADLGGLGGFVHWRDHGSGRLRMVAAGGLTPEAAEAWADLSEDADAAPARAVRGGAFVWAVGDSLGTGAAGTAAGPLFTADGRVGALSVLLAGPAGPDPARRSALGAVAAWAAGHLEHRPGGPATVDGPGGEAPRVLAIRHWEYDATTGSVTLVPPVVDLPGDTPQGFEESADLGWYLSGIEDLPSFTADIRAAFDRGTAYDTRYRVHHGDGTSGWVRARGHVVPGEDGTSARMAGTLWGPAHSQAAWDPVVTILRDMGDGFLTVDEDWRITFANKEARRLLGPGRTLPGRSLHTSATSLTVEPDAYSAPPTETWMMPSDSASANPWRAAVTVCDEVMLTAG